MPIGPSPDAETLEPTLIRGTGELVGIPEKRPAASAATGEPVSINLVQAPIAAVAKAVLGDILRANFTVSEKVTGSVTLQTPQPVPRERLLEMFEAALQAGGAGVVSGSGGYRILPLDEAIAAGGRLNVGAKPGGVALGVTTQVVQLRYVSAPEMERLLKSVAPQTSSVRTDPQRNLLILTGSRNDLVTLIEAVDIFDVDWMKGMSFGMVPVEAADPDVIAQELDVVFANDREIGKGIVRFVPNRRLRSVLIISARPEHLARAEQWIRKLDMVGRATEKQVHVYRVQHRQATELAQLLQRVYASQEQPRGPSTASLPSVANGTRPPQTESLVIVPERAANAPPAGLPVLQAPIAAPAEAAVAAGASSSSADPNAGPRAAGDGALRPIDDRTSGIGIVPDAVNNALVISATAAEYRRIRQILAGIDVAPNQVLLEATIAEVTLNDELKLGMRWYFERNHQRFRLTDSLLGAVAPVFPGFSYLLDRANVQVVLNTLATITNVNVVSSPSLMVIDNKKAVLQVGDEVPVATQSAVAVLAPGAPIVNSVSFRNTGLILGITPRISDKGRVLLDIEQEASDVIRTTTSNIDSPTIQQRRVRTTVAVDDGESVLLAGLIQDKATRQRGEVPVLGDVPLVGNLFKSKTDTIQRTELLIAITPRIVSDRGTSRAIVEEFRDKLNFNTRPQRHGPPDRREQLDRIQR